MSSASSPVITSTTLGNASTFQPIDVLRRGLAALETPRDSGRVVLIARRGEGGVRESLGRVEMTPESGIPGDAWGRHRRGSADAQLAVMQADVAALIANGQPLVLFGDNLYLDLDLSSANLPPGSRLRAGSATLEVTPLPHTGCQKFSARFGPDALRFISMRELRHRNLRGLYMKVIETGAMAVGDRVQVVFRPSAAGAPTG